MTPDIFGRMANRYVNPAEEYEVEQPKPRIDRRELGRAVSAGAALGAAMLLILSLGGCTNDSGAASTLRAAGYTDVRFTGYRWFMCGQDDVVATGFSATGPSGLPVSGAVCEGVLKGKTIRLD